jgi:two-component system, LytTR family, sensor kinase
MLQWPVVLAIWTVPALLSVFETEMFAAQNGHAIALWRVLASEVPPWYIWAALTPAIFRLGRRWPLDRGLRVASLGVHLTASLVAGTLYAAAAALAALLAGRIRQALPVAILDWWLSGLPLIVLSYFGILGISYAIGRAREAAQLKAELAVAQLGALKAQIQPHFLFNTLNAITALVRDQETKSALATLALLSDLLRSVLTADAVHEVALSDEITFIEQYLGIMEVRFSDRLRVTWKVPAELRQARVPTFVLQPLVENAIRHGIAKRTEAGRIEIAARRAGDRLVLTVADDGPGPNGSGNGGVGLANTRARLEHLYGDATVVLEGTAPGALATITMPLAYA